MTTAAGGVTHLAQPSFANYLLEVHYYAYLPQVNATAVLTTGTFVPLVEVGACPCNALGPLGTSAGAALTRSWAQCLM